MRIFVKNILPLLLLVTIVSCKSSKGVSGGSTAEIAEGMNTLEAVIENHADFTTLTSRMRITLPVKGNPTSLNGTLKIRRDEFIQLSVLAPVPLVKIEAASIEIGREQITVIDRINKRYVVAPISELKSLIKTDLDYFALQALFTNSVFLPGKKEINSRDFPLFSLSRSADNGDYQLFRKEKGLNYIFSIDPSYAELTASRVQTSSSPYAMEWMYSNFTPLGNKRFPSEMNILLDGGGRAEQARIELSRLSVDSEDISPIQIPARYDEVKLEKLIRQLINM
ncbi:MAG: DUF4292 domain-containing protein [Bacteroides sp.]|nr:DUF4292 domain-containing protein [Bacteroides sp.]